MNILVSYIKKFRDSLPKTYLLSDNSDGTVIRDISNCRELQELLPGSLTMPGPDTGPLLTDGIRMSSAPDKADAPIECVPSDSCQGRQPGRESSSPCERNILQEFITHIETAVSTQAETHQPDICPSDSKRIQDSQAAGVASSHENISPRTAFPSSSSESYRTIVEDMPALICRFRDDGTLTFVNRAYCRYFDKEVDELIGKFFFCFIPEDDQEIVRNRYKSLTSETPTITYDHKVIAPDGTTCWQTRTDRAIFDETGQLIEYQSIGFDITRQKKAEFKTLHLNSILKAISRVNQLISRESNRDRLLKGVCEYITESVSYDSAAILLIDDAGTITAGFEAGSGEDFFKRIDIHGSCHLIPCASRALHQDDPVITKGSDSLCGQCPLRVQPADYTAITMRMEYDGKIFGLLSAGSIRHFSISPEELDLFRNIASDIAFALHSIKLRQERDLAQVNLEKSHVTIRSLTESCPDSCLVIDRGGTILALNQTSAKALGKNAEDLIGEKFLAHLDPDTARSGLPMYIKSIRRKAPVRFEEKCRGRILHRVIWPVRNDEGTIDQLAIYSRDVTQQRQDEHQIRESEDRSRNLVENCLVGISIIKDGNIIYSNPEYIRILENCPDSLERLVSECIHPEDVTSFCNVYQEITSGKRHHADIYLRIYPFHDKALKQGMKWILCKAIGLNYQGGQAVLLNMLDITRTKHLERLVMINDKMSSLGRIAAGISHEIRNPLSTINVCLSVLKRFYCNVTTLEDKDVRNISDTLDDMESASTKIEAVIRKVIDFAKPGIPQLHLTCLNHCIGKALELSTTALKKMNVRVHTELDPHLPKCFLDRQCVIQVVLNLVTNAAEAMNKKNTDNIIDIRTSRNDNFVIATVSDSGPGIAPEIRNKILDPFFTTKKNGSGIGLSICHRIMTDHGGFLTISESQWNGAKFTIGFPIEKRRGSN